MIDIEELTKKETKWYLYLLKLAYYETVNFLIILKYSLKFFPWVK
jgi:hypothetical protein